MDLTGFSVGFFYYLKQNVFLKNMEFYIFNVISNLNHNSRLVRREAFAVLILYLMLLSFNKLIKILFLKYIMISAQVNLLIVFFYSISLFFFPERTEIYSIVNFT